MITNQVIEAIYKKYDKRPKSIDSLDFALLFEKAGLQHDILIDPETNEMTISSIAEDSPFHQIPLHNINAIVPFEEWTAIVMHSSIIFLNVKKPINSIHIKAPSLSLWDRIKGVAVKA
ncbi:MAG: hypothetical protein LUD17_04890 [Bacteroidales bacterium]|nr:hypothetical protein [Bacteroidales bacterium]MCD8386212.1 hypothetical protein [Bacteroidales bacterium]